MYFEFIQAYQTMGANGVTFKVFICLMTLFIVVLYMYFLFLIFNKLKYNIHIL